MNIDVKEQIQLPSENICDCNLTLNSHEYCEKIYMLA